MRIPALLKTLPQKVLCALCSGKSYSGALEDKGEKKFHNPCVLFKETFFFLFFFSSCFKTFYSRAARICFPTVALVGLLAPGGVEMWSQWQCLVISVPVGAHSVAFCRLLWEAAGSIRSLCARCELGGSSVES